MIRWPGRRFALLTLLILIGLVTVGTPLQAEDRLTASQSPKLDGALNQILRASTPPKQPSGQDVRWPYATDTTSGRLQVIVEATQADAVSSLRTAIENAGGRVQLAVGTKIQADFASQASISTIAQRTEVQRVRAPVRPVLRQGTIVSEGVDISQAQAWQEAGIDGAGVKVGIMDSGFAGYEGLLGGELPPEGRVNARSFRSDRDIECSDCSESGQVHGRAVAEIVHDVAPGAELFLANFNTGVEMEAAVNWMIEGGVDVINTSFGFLTTSCPYEGEGILESIFQNAREAGVTWVASAGNDGRSHWAGSFEDPDEDGFTSFADEDDSQTLRGIEEGEPILALLWWDDPCSGATHDYDVVLSKGEDEIDRSFRAGPTNGWPLELLSVEAPESGTYDIRVEGVDPGENRFSMIFLSQRPEHIVAAGSAGLTEPEMSPNVISVGATDLNNDLEPFSSQGPTPDGRIKPEIVAPDGVSNRTFRPFFGTSASSPHMAGAAALVQSAFPDHAPNRIETFLLERAEDLGEAGRDGEFGAGLLTLGQPPEDRAPAAPSDLNVSAAGPTEINLRWADNAEDEAGVIVLRQIQDETELDEVTRLAADATTFTDTDLAPATPYCYAVRAFNDSGTSPPTNTVCATTPQIENEPPIAEAGSDRTVSVGTTVQLDGTASRDPEGEQLRFNWAVLDKPQSSTAELPNATTARPAFQPDVPGTYRFQLTVTDPEGASATDTVEIRAESGPSGLVVLVFTELEFRPPTAWSRSLGEGCVTYRNVSTAMATVSVTTPDGSTVAFDVPPDRDVLVCGNAVHIDTRRSSS